MIEFLNYVHVEGSVGELLMGLIKVGASLVFVTFLILLVVREIRKFSED